MTVHFQELKHGLDSYNPKHGDILRIVITTTAP